ncbi:hypothetical protein CC86DRAFT_213985 [Ophiobolus disseminans]|uniref:Uncharacterized protein n=1 Tax=Ophiobolus disseminans TaxID=1469910 RepID=A0A6A7A4G0_9PLEO|nr:hypothetical protein CC86DRAFT_213985 [Ophiobolus disseminans]
MGCISARRQHEKSGTGGGAARTTCCLMACSLTTADSMSSLVNSRVEGLLRCEVAGDCRSDRRASRHVSTRKFRCIWASWWRGCKGYSSEALANLRSLATR